MQVFMCFKLWFYLACCALYYSLRISSHSLPRCTCCNNGAYCAPHGAQSLHPITELEMAQLKRVHACKNAKTNCVSVLSHSTRAFQLGWLQHHKPVLPYAVRKCCKRAELVRGDDMQQEDARHYGPEGGTERLGVPVRQHRQSVPGGRWAVVAIKESF